MGDMQFDLCGVISNVMVSTLSANIKSRYFYEEHPCLPLLGVPLHMKERV
jgi:hypothetical protein